MSRVQYFYKTNQDFHVHVSFIHKIFFGLFLFAYFLFSEIFNLNLRFAVYGKRDSKFFNDGLRWAFSID